MSTTDLTCARRSSSLSIHSAARAVTRNVAILGLVLLAGPVQANPPVDEMKKGLCLDLRVNDKVKPCNNDLRLVDDGRGEVMFVTGYGETRAAPTSVLAFTTAQTPDMENAYGYALRITSVTLMAYDKPVTQRVHPATGLCFMVKPARNGRARAP